jgi:SAM-dependent methyltransferase
MPKAAQYLPDVGSLESDAGVDLEVRQCSGCGLVQLSGEPVPYFREVIRAAGYSPEMMDFRRKQFGSLMEKFSLKGKKIIEIGCGRGEILSIMRECGGDAYGLEYSEDSVAHCTGNGLKVSKGFVETATCSLEHSPFDAFLILNFLEHLPDPTGTLEGIQRNLADDGVGLVEVPNFDMILRERLFSEFIGDHLLYFTRDTLCTTLRISGFDVVECSEIWHDYIISAIVRKRQPTPISGFRDHQLRLRNDIEQYVRRFERGKVAVWGAGHQALALISLSGLAGKIRFVVDSAPFKQGKYTPATHIPIVSPDMLRLDPINAVIVMAGGYSDEVATILRQQFDGDMGIAIVRASGLEIL